MRARVYLPREIIPHVHLASAVDTSLVCARNAFVVNETLERHSVVTTFVIRPSASYWRILFYLNIFFPRETRREQGALIRVTFNCKSSPDQARLAKHVTALFEP